MEISNSNSDRSGIGNRELAGIYIACGLAFVAEWILSHWQVTPSVGRVWLGIGRGISIFWICGLVATNVIAWSAAKSTREGWTIAMGGIGLFAALSAWNASAHETQWFFESAKWLGLYGLCALIYQVLHPGGTKNLLIAICFSLFVPLSTAYLTATYVMRPETLDLQAYAFDLSLGGKVAPYLFTLFQRSAVINFIASVAYVSLLGTYVILFAVQSRFADRTVVPALRVFLIAAVLGFGCYFLFPVVGPKNFFGETYPTALPAFGDFNLQWTPVFPTARNGMPSLHFAWALLLVLNAPRKSSVTRPAFALFCFLTMIATMGLGEHYFVDLVAALPFTAMVQAIGLRMNNGRDQSRELTFSALRSVIVLAAFLLLIAASPQWLHSPLISWLAVFFLMAHFIIEIVLQTRAAGVCQA